MTPHTSAFLWATVAPETAKEAMGLAPSLVARIKAQQQGLGLPKELEIGITFAGIVVSSPEDFDHEILIKELEVAGIHVDAQRWEVCG